MLSGQGRGDLMSFWSRLFDFIGHMGRIFPSIIRSNGQNPCIFIEKRELPPPGFCDSGVQNLPMIKHFLSYRLPTPLEPSFLRPFSVLPWVKYTRR